MSLSNRSAFLTFDCPSCRIQPIRFPSGSAIEYSFVISISLAF
jgi:hypothetical protein